MSGLGDLAASTRGTLFNVIGTGDNVFERIAIQTSAFYLLGVEEAAGDRDGKRHRIDVEVRRRGVTLHSRRAFVLSSAASARRTPEENLIDALRSPFAVAELPLRATTFVTQDRGSDKVRLMVAAEVGAAGAMPAEYTLGYALVDRDGKVAGGVQREQGRWHPPTAARLRRSSTSARRSLEPGTYSLRLAAVDSEGRRGSVIHTVSAWQMAGEAFAFGDLFVGNMPEAGVMVKPGVEPHVDNGALAAFIELYSTTPASLANAVVTFEIAVGPGRARACHVARRRWSATRQRRGAWHRPPSRPRCCRPAATSRARRSCRAASRRASWSGRSCSARCAPARWSTRAR